MSVDATSQKRRAASATTDPARIRELLLANLFAVFSERDPERRLQVIERNYTEDVIWSDPDRTTHGHEEMNEQAQKLLDRMPDFVFSCGTGARQPRSGPPRLQPRRAGAAARGQRDRRGGGARWTDRPLVHALER
jgi:hypothetical protein